MQKLTDLFLKSLRPASKRYVVAEGDGLYVEVMPSGRKAFRFRYRLNGKREKVTIGSYPSTSLKVARLLQAEMREAVSLGKSPALAKREARQKAAAGGDQLDNFEALAEKWIEDVLKPANKNARQDEVYVRRDIVPKLGMKQPGAITTQDVWRCVEMVKQRGHGHAARRVRSVIKRIFDYGQSRGLTQSNPATSVQPAHIKAAIPRSRVLAPSEIKSWVRALETSSISRSTKLALRFLLLVPARKGELLGARWSDIDFVSNTWEIPASASKNGAPLTHKLPVQAMSILRDLKQLSMDSQWVMPSTRGLGKAHLSSSAMNTALRGVRGLPEGFVIHDLRRTVRTYLSELGVATNVAELCLNHRPGGVKGVYDRSELIELRYQALAKWEAYVQSILSDGDVNPDAFHLREQLGEVLQLIRTNPDLKEILMRTLSEDQSSGERTPPR